MKKVVVVVDEHKEVFEGEKLKVEFFMTGSINPQEETLRIFLDGKCVAAFNKWTYWRETT